MTTTPATTLLMFDTHALVERLIKSGFTKEQAEGVTDAVRAIDLSHLATKQDVNEVRTEIKQTELRLQSTIWGAAVAIVAILSALKYFG